MSSRYEPSGATKGCGNCVHLYTHTLWTTCKAFPDGIPGLFANGEELHDKPFPGDHGIRYEPVPAKSIDELVEELERDHPELTS
jgi:hypothetical protein